MRPVTPTVNPPPLPTHILRPPAWLAAILLTTVIAGFHFYFLLHAGGFWRDEVNLINLANSHSLAAMKKDSFPLLMPLLVRGWSALGLARNDLTLRLLGMLIGLGIPAALWVAAGSARRPPPLLGLALFGFNGTLIVFGDSLRAYGLGCVLIMLTAAAAVALVRQPSWRRAGALALLAILSVQALYHNAVLVGAICLGAWMVCWRRKSWLLAAQFFLAGLAAALSLLPYAAGLIAGQETPSAIRTGLKSWRFFAAFQDSLGFPLGQYIYLWALLAALLVFLAGAALFRDRKDSAGNNDDTGDLRLFAGTTVFAALAGYVLFLRLAAFPSQSWYLLPLLALAAVCFEIGLPVWRGKMRAVFFGLVAATALIAVPTAGRYLHTRFTNIDTWAAELKAAAVPEDYVVVVPWFCGITFSHYFHGATPWTTLPPLADHATHRYDLVQLQIQNTNAIQPVLKRIVTTLQHGHRVWILAGMGWMDVPDPGTAAPASLPPAPLPMSGWSEMPYTMVWASQVAHLIGDRAARFGRVKNPTAGRQIIENTELFVADGWKNP
jgi:hypothetical protein